MKRLVFVLFTLGLICQPAIVWAELKIGYIDSAVLMEKIPELKNVQRQMEQLQQRYDADARDRQSKLMKMQEDFQKQELLMSESKKAEMRAAFQDEAAKLDQFVQDKFGQDGELTSKHIELTAPIRRGIVQMTGSAYVGNRLVSEGDLTARISIRED